MRKNSKSNLRRVILYSLSILLILISSFIIWNWDKFYRISDIEIRDINCSNKVELLQGVFESDQRVRTQSVPFKEVVKVNHENLEIVVSYLEKCGMPTLAEVSNKQLGAIWLVLQHSIHPKYTKKYFPYIEEAVKNGDLKKEQYALMKDRILMNEGKPQIYGSQIKKEKLYKLAEPEKVNSRRKEMNMEPIEDYLNYFNIEFDIPQE
jgi:hypothetical protein